MSRTPPGPAPARQRFNAMSYPLQQTALVAAQITAQWMTRQFGLPATLAVPDRVDTQLPLLTIRAGDADARVAVVPLWDIAADSETHQRKAAMEQRLAQLGVGSLVAWIPPMAEIPTGDADAFVSRVAEAADALEPDSRGEIALPVKLRLRKNGAEGSYLNAVGGLAQQWARFTGQVMGQYQLDAGAIHRLPEDPEQVTQLIDFLVLVANGLREVGASRGRRRRRHLDRAAARRGPAAHAHRRFPARTDGGRHGRAQTAAGGPARRRRSPGGYGRRHQDRHAGRTVSLARA